MQALWFVLKELRVWTAVGPRGPCGGANPPSPRVVQGGSQVTQLNNNCAKILIALVLCRKGWGCDKNARILNFCVWSVLIPNPVYAVSTFCSNGCFFTAVKHPWDSKTYFFQMSVCPNGPATDKTLLLEGFLLPLPSLRDPWLLRWGCTSPKYSTYETEQGLKPKLFSLLLVQSNKMCFIVVSWLFLCRHNSSGLLLFQQKRGRIGSAKSLCGFLVRN